MQRQNKKQTQTQEVEAGFWGVAPVEERKPWIKRRQERQEAAAKKAEQAKKAAKTEKVAEEKKADNKP